MSKPFIRPSQAGDVPLLAQVMRECDRQELFHSSRKSPEDALAAGLLMGNCWTVQWGEKVVAMFGICGIPDRIGMPWMLASDDLLAIRKPFLRECRGVVEGWLERYAYLTNSCWSKNDVHIRWIRWLGFTFEGGEDRNGETFLHFHRNHHV